uniref:Uncharacterized protein n=1 Tax=Rhizophora mucronata TaxID=61149 RepID=A0A2P2N4S4_RHIMU
MHLSHPFVLIYVLRVFMWDCPYLVLLIGKRNEREIRGSGWWLFVLQKSLFSLAFKVALRSDWS